GGTGADIKPYVVDARALAAPGSSALAPHAILADGSRSTDADGRIATYHFDFGDGIKAGPQVSPFASHIYNAGQWTLKLTVTDSSGNVSTALQEVGVAADTTVLPVTSHVYAAAGTWNARVIVTDPSGASDSATAVVTVTDAPGDG